MDLSGSALAGQNGGQPVTIHRELCRSGLDTFREAVSSGQNIHVACTQEAPLFLEVAESILDADHAGTDATDGAEASDAALIFTNIRETAGWSSAGADAMPKIASLLAQARHQPKMAPGVTLESKGVCLVYGPGQLALDTAAKLAGRLSPIVLLTDADDAFPPAQTQAQIFKGRVRKASGVLGRFSLEVAGLASARPSSREALTFDDAVAAQQLDCDLIIDLSGSTPLFTGHDRREGYFHVDQDDPAALANAMFEASDLVGEFEKPRYISFDGEICAHARSGQVGCTNCLDVCPLGAISPAGDTVAIDPAVCGGCGNCASVCPTGAASYAFPDRGDLIARMSILIETFAEAGGEHPVLLAHDESHGSELISAMARFGRGLPANVLPISLNSVLTLGHDTLAAALALGAERMFVLAPPKHREELTSLEDQAALANALLDGLGYGSDRIQIVIEHDPDAAEEALHEIAPLGAIATGGLVAAGSKREVARSVFAKLHDQSAAKPDVVELPAGAPYGRINVNVEGCTLCLSCVGACPANALRDNPDKPQLSFVEAACVQCGVCVATCPENVIQLEARYNFATEALAPDLIKSEEPFHCVSCGKAFGAKSSIERVVEQLRGHSMFKDDSQLQLIQMCDNCRVSSLANSKNDPFKMGKVPEVRTTDDYFDEEDQKPIPGGKKPSDFLS
ncbi:MAG: 4Fe-4S binding protein [Alphaproteobacteria bacterium]|nr:4Fe-4S binding protein [Alphaproteobacteria bacterium]